MRQRFSVVIPFFNEASFLPRTLQSWLDQERLPDEFVLVDNGSTDGSAELCREQLADFPGPIIYASDNRPGKVNALETGCDKATGTHLALSDADTYYPPHYLALAEDLINRHDDRIVALMALGATDDTERMTNRVRRAFYVTLSHVMKKQSFTGGYGQILRADVLEAVGGFSESRWPFVLLDHEIMQRLLKHGDSLYHIDLWCVPSGRRADRSAVRWTFLERILYHVIPYQFKDRFFYDFLGPRFAKRGMLHVNLRDRSWEE